MNGIWVRSHDGQELVLCTSLFVKPDEETDGYLLVDRLNGAELAYYRTEEAALQQLNDLQSWLVGYAQSDGIATYDLQRRQVQDEEPLE